MSAISLSSAGVFLPLADTDVVADSAYQFENLNMSKKSAQYRKL